MNRTALVLLLMLAAPSAAQGPVANADAEAEAEADADAEAEAEANAEIGATGGSSALRPTRFRSVAAMPIRPNASETPPS